jgi:hypothetical protein
MRGCDDRNACVPEVSPRNCGLSPFSQWSSFFRGHDLVVWGSDVREAEASGGIGNIDRLSGRCPAPILTHRDVGELDGFEKTCGDGWCRYRRTSGKADPRP